MIKAFALSLITLSFATGCMKKPDHTPDYGPEVEFTEVEKASRVDMPISPEMIRKNQEVSIDVYQVIDVQSPMTLWQRSDLVTQQSEEPGSFHWTFHVTMKEKNDAGQWQVSQRDYGPLCYEKEYGSGACDLAASSTASQPQEQPKSIRQYTLEGVRAKDVTQPYKVTYHNLKREDGFLPVPHSVASKPNCGGVKNCTQGLRFVRVSVDRVIWENESKGTKTNYRFTYSTDIPTYVYDWLPGDVYPTNLVESCAQTWIEIKNAGQTQVVPVRECMEVSDFQFGTTTN